MRRGTASSGDTRRVLHQGVCLVAISRPLLACCGVCRTVNKSAAPAGAMHATHVVCMHAHNMCSMKPGTCHLLTC